jgi:TRAP-type C4-dicarboxylate transport system substrate-binding protein
MRTIAAALLLSSLFSAPALSQEVWRAATEYPATAMPGEGLARFAELVGEETQGRLVVQPGYDGPDGLKSAGIPAAVQAGKIAVGDTFGGALSGIDPIFQISSLPFLATSLEQTRALHEAARPRYEAAFLRLDQILLYTTPWPASGFWTREPVTTSAALRGLAVRTYDATSTAVLRAAGAAPVELSFGDTMPRLKDGTVTAVLSSGDGGAGRRLWEYLPHFTAIGYAMPLSFTTVSRTSLEALDPATRSAVMEAGRRTEALQWQALETRTARNEAVMRANGVTIRSPQPDLAAALAEAARQTNAAWEAKAGPDVAAILAAYRSRGP